MQSLILQPLLAKIMHCAIPAVSSQPRLRITQFQQRVMPPRQPRLLLCKSSSQPPILPEEIAQSFLVNPHVCVMLFPNLLWFSLTYFLPCMSLCIQIFHVFICLLAVQDQWPPREQDQRTLTEVQLEQQLSGCPHVYRSMKIPSCF